MTKAIGGGGVEMKADGAGLAGRPNCGEYKLSW